MLRRHLSKAAEEVSRHFLERLVYEDVMEPERLAAVLDTLRPAALDAVRLIFAQEMEAALQQVVTSGKVADVLDRRK